jgi:hypothetical protein
MGKIKTKPLASIGTFIAMPKRVVNSPVYQALNHPAARLLWDIAGQYRGDDNGRLLAGWREMSKRGWRSSDTLNKARRELENAGLIYKTVQGHRPNKASWYAITWFTLDKLKGFDPGAEAGYVRWAFEKKSLSSNSEQIKGLTRPANEQQKARTSSSAESIKQKKPTNACSSDEHPLEEPSAVAPRLFLVHQRPGHRT